jgi:hypothetical protein
MYDIIIRYATGDSFGRQDTTDKVDVPMPTLEIAKENLKRIREHHKAISLRDENNWQYKKRNMPIDWPPFVLDNGERILLLTVDNKEVEYYPFWTGYFDSLYGGDVVLIDNDMSFDV